MTIERIKERANYLDTIHLNVESYLYRDDIERKVSVEFKPINQVPHLIIRIGRNVNKIDLHDIGTEMFDTSDYLEALEHLADDDYIVETLGLRTDY